MLCKPEFKAKIAFEAMKGEQTVSELLSGFGIHPTMIHKWKRDLLEGASGILHGAVLPARRTARMQRPSKFYMLRLVR